MSGGGAAAAASFLPGELVDGKYRVERVLGRGGMGLVLLARNVLLEERVAIKVLVGRSTPALRARLLMEARAAARLHSDHVVRVFDVGYTSSGDPYLVMEYLEGEPLSEVLERGGRQPAAQVVQWALEACQGLAVAHCNGIIHRDLKPANLFLCRRQDGAPRLKVLDFGVAKLPEREGLVTTTHPLGSPMYMAPEQFAKGGDVDARSDVWGLGVVLYEALTGKPPFVARSVFDLAAQLKSEAHVPVREHCPEVPEGLSLAIDRCLAKRREDRWQSLLELARAIAPFGAAGASEALARLERSAQRVKAGVTSTWEVREVAEGSALARHAQVPTASLAMSLVVSRARLRSVCGPRTLRIGGWLLGAALAGTFGYCLATWLPAVRAHAPLLEPARHALGTAWVAAPQLAGACATSTAGVTSNAAPRDREALGRDELALSEPTIRALERTRPTEDTGARTQAAHARAAPRSRGQRKPAPAPSDSTRSPAAASPSGAAASSGAANGGAASSAAASSPLPTGLGSSTGHTAAALAEASSAAGPLPLDREVSW